MAQTKRLTREEKEQKAISDIINKMFEIAGHDVTYNDIKDRKDNWFQEWTMTVEQSEKWVEWGTAYLYKNFRYSKTYATKQMGWISMMWGLKFEDFKA
jgi:hypothetical protein